MRNPYPSWIFKVKLQRVRLLDLLPDRFVLFHYPGFNVAIRDRRPGMIKIAQNLIEPTERHYTVEGLATVTLEGEQGVLRTITLNPAPVGVDPELLFESFLQTFASIRDLHAYVASLKHREATGTALWWGADPLDLQRPAFVTFHLAHTRSR